MTVEKAPAKKPLPETIPSSAQLKEANRKAALAKTKARQAKAALKNARKVFKLARKIAKAARQEADGLQKAITKAGPKAAAIKKAGAARRAPAKNRPRVSAKSKPRPPVKLKPVRKTTRTAASAPLDADISPVEADSNPIGAQEDSTSTTPAQAGRDSGPRLQSLSEE